MAKAKRNGKHRIKSGGSNRSTKFDRWAHLESAVRAKQKSVEFIKQHGPVKIIMKDGEYVG
jgi:hypothetical protein